MGDLEEISTSYGIFLNFYQGSRDNLIKVLASERTGNYVYFVKPSPDHVSRFKLNSGMSRDRIYKVGYTRQFLYERVKFYGPGTQLINFEEVENAQDTEEIIIEEIIKQQDIFKLPDKKEFFETRYPGRINRIFCSVSEKCLPVNDERVQSLYQRFRERIKFTELANSYYSNTFVYLTDNNDHKSREQSMERLFSFFQRKFISLKFRPKYEFVKALDLNSLDIQRAIEIILS